MNLSVITGFSFDFSPVLVEDVASISPGTQSIIKIAKKILQETHFEGFNSIFQNLSSSSDFTEVKKGLNYLCAGLSNKEPHEIDENELNQIFLKFHEKTKEITLYGIPVVHRLFYHVYRLEKERTPQIDGDRWGEIHAFKDLERLKDAISATCVDLTTTQANSEVCELFDIFDKKHLESVYEKRLCATYRPIFDGIRDRIDLEDALQLVDVSTPRRRTHQFSTILEKALLAAECHNSLKPVKWLTGTNSYTLVGMHLAMIKGLTSRLSLVPTGTLLNHNLVPLAGELGDGIGKRGINIKRLSGCHAFNYMGAFRYAKEKEFYFDQALTWSKLLETIKYLPIDEKHLSDKASLNPFKVALLRYLHFAHPSDETRKIIKSHLSDWIDTCSTSFELKAELLTSLFHLVENEGPKEIDPLYQSILDKPAYPLVFASNSLDEDDLMRLHGDIRGECAFEGSLELGKDIQAVITEEAAVEEVKRLLKGYRVTVLSFDVAELVMRKHFDLHELKDLEPFES
jgi:hypothetical protein